MATKFLDKTGLSHFWSKIKAWCNSTFAAITHSHAWSTITGKPTTISGYGITDAKIANGKITLGSNSITPLTSVPSHNQASNTINAMTGYSKPSSGSAITTSDNLNNAIGKLEAKVDAIDDSNYVHKIGNENISGIKSFNIEANNETNSVVIQSSEIVRGTAPSSDKFCSLAFADNTFDVIEDGNNEDAVTPSRLATIDYAARSTGRVDFQFYILNPQTKTNDGLRFRIGYEANGTPFFTGPSTKDNPYNGEIITYDWLPKDTRLVHTVGNETINGSKTFANNWTAFSGTESNVALDNTIAVRTATPSNPLLWRVIPRDKNGDAFGTLCWTQRTSGSRDVRLDICNANAEFAYFYLGWDANGIAHATAPSTSASRSTATDIVTRDWIPKDIRIVHTTGNETIDGVKIFTGDVKSDSYYYSYFDVLKGASITETKYRGIVFGDNNRYVSSKYRLGHLVCQLNIDGTSLTYISSYKNEANATTAASITVGWDSTDSYASAPSTRSNRTEGTDIVTRNWIPNDTRIVHTSGNEAISGSKLFTSSLVTTSTVDYVMNKLRLNFTKGSADPSTAKVADFLVLEGNQNNDYYDNRIGAFEVVVNTNGNITTGMWAYKNQSANHTGTSVLLTFPKNGVSTSGYVMCPAVNPHVDNQYTIGAASTRWKIIYATTSSINTSDERVKHEINKVSDVVLDAWEDIEWKQFKMLDAVQEKGINSARIHIGTIAQHIDTVFKSHNLDASRYGLFCYDEWEEEKEVRNQVGDIVTNYRPAGNRYSLRYEEALCMEAAYQRRKNKILENRINELEKRLAKLEDII